MNSSYGVAWQPPKARRSGWDIETDRPLSVEARAPPVLAGLGRYDRLATDIGQQLGRVLRSQLKWVFPVASDVPLLPRVLIVVWPVERIVPAEKRDVEGVGRPRRGQGGAVSRNAACGSSRRRLVADQKVGDSVSVEGTSQLARARGSQAPFGLQGEEIEGRLASWYPTQGPAGGGTPLS